MRRRSDRGKTKTTPKEEEPPEKVRKSQRHSRRRKKSSSSSEEESSNQNKEVENIAKPLDIQVQDIELPQGQNPNPSTTITNTETEGAKQTEDTNKEWKEDSVFWETSEAPKQPIENSGEDKEESSMWKVQSANGASGGEIQKLKICRQKPTESPEIGEASLRKRLSRGPRDSRSTDESTQDDSEKDTKKSKHRTRTSSRSSPLVSPTVVCDMSVGSPTKIKIINVSQLSTENKGKSSSDEIINENHGPKSDHVLEISQASDTLDTLDIALPSEESEKIVETEENKEVSAENIEKSTTAKNVQELASHSPSPTKNNAKTQSSGNSDCSEDDSQPQNSEKKHSALKSTIQRKLSISTSAKHESSDSEDDTVKKKEDQEDRRESTDTCEPKEMINDKENENTNCFSSSKDNTVENSSDKTETEKTPVQRKRRWGSSKSNRSENKPVLINTDSLKNLIPDAKPVPADELQLSVEEEEGQLDDDDEEDEVVALVAKEEEKQMERERQREQREKEQARLEEDRRKRQERFAAKDEKAKSEQKLAAKKQSDATGKGASRKILLLTDDPKKLAPSPSPPRRKPTNVLYITHLVRPFTVQQLKNLLLRTGAIAENGFWIDKIKSKCYVEYMTEDQAVETRHALHGVRWPTSNPKTLIVEFATKDDLVIAQTLTEEPEVPRKSEPLNMVEGWVADQARITERNKRAPVREWDVGKPEHPDEALEYEMKMKEKREQERKSRKERHHRSPSPENEPPARKSRKKEEDAPAKLLDDLFRKTKTSPCIYWLPLTQEQIAVKEEMRRQHMAEHERRMAELKKVEIARRERERRNRK